MNNNYNKQPFFSIVMAVYGVEKFINEALNDIKRQTCKDWELILVDDCTQDKSIQIAESFAREDPRISIVHHEKNMGLSAARNTGIKNARGKYVWFPDPDDTYEENLLEKAKSMFEHNNLIPIIMFGHSEEWYKKNGKFSHSKQIYEPDDQILTTDSIRRSILEFEQNTQYGYAWNKIYSLKYLKLNKLTFKNIAYVEDIEFNIRAFQDLTLLGILGGSYYHYAKRPSNSLTGKYNARFFELHLFRIKLLYNQLLSWGNLYLTKETLSILGVFLCRYIIATLRMNCFSNAKMSHNDRINWCINLFNDEFITTLVSTINTSRLNIILKLCINAIKLQNIRVLLVIGRITYLVESYFYPLLSILKSY